MLKILFKNLSEPNLKDVSEFGYKLMIDNCVCTTTYPMTQLPCYKIQTIRPSMLFICHKTDMNKAYASLSSKMDTKVNKCSFMFVFKRLFLHPIFAGIYTNKIS